jgi:hypothetical protein
MARDSQQLTLQDLIRTLKGDRTYEQLEDESGGRVKAQRWHQFAVGDRVTTFPKPATIAAVAETLPCDIEVVVHAFARAVGIDIHQRRSSFIDMLPPSVDNMSERNKALALAFLRALAEEDGGDGHRGGRKPKPRPRGDIPPLA